MRRNGEREIRELEKVRERGVSANVCEKGDKEGEREKRMRKRGK